MSFIVGIDGPAGSGKGTVTKQVANRLGLINIDTGSTYRCVALETINQGVGLEEKDKIIEIAKTIKIEIETLSDGDKIFLKNTNGSKKIKDIFIDSKIEKINNKL